MSSLCSVCNSYPCPGCTGAVIDENVRLREENRVLRERGVGASELAALLRVEELEGQAEERSRIIQRLRARADALLDDHLMTNPRCRRDELLAALIEIERMEEP